MSSLLSLKIPIFKLAYFIIASLSWIFKPYPIPAKQETPQKLLQDEVLVECLIDAIDFLNERNWNYKTADHTRTKLE